MKQITISMLLLICFVLVVPAQAQFDINFGGELKMRYRANLVDSAKSPGFSFYELEFFADGDVTDYSSFYIEYNLMHSNKPDPENVWIDLHKPMKEAFTHGGMGVRIGHYQVPFGYENDDNEGYMYQGRSGINHSLIHGEKIDGWRMRERQIGVTGAISLGPLTLWPGVYNGNGSWLVSGGSDNAWLDHDYAIKGQVWLADVEFGGSYWLAPGVDTTKIDYQNNPKGILHTRDITRYGGHFKYPALALFVSQDPSLGGKRFLVFGEFIMGKHEAVYSWDASGDQEVMGGFVEVQAGIIPEVLVGFLRADYYDPDTDVDNNETIGVTPGINWFFWTSMRFILEYEFYSDNDYNAPLSYQDRVAAEISITF